MKSILVFLVVIALAIPVKSETWGCSKRRLGGSIEHPHDLELTASIENGFGSIIIQGLPIIYTWFGIEGFERVWRWENDSRSTAKGYAFVIDDNHGRYYVFLDDELTPSRKTYICHKH